VTAVRLEELDLPIPEELIAQEPVEPRDSCRLMRLTADGRREHRVFSELPDVLRPGDTLVFNDSKVLPARVLAHRATGGKVELLFLRPVATKGSTAERWEALARPSHRLRPGEEVGLEGGDSLRLVEAMGEGSWLVAPPDGASLLELMERHGRLPLPPYIKKYPDDPSSYQTVYAAALGSAAAPTAGLHFTPRLLDQLRSAGVRAAYVTLHVGLDTFQPIREEFVEDHRIHREAFSVGAEALEALRTARAEGRRVIAVGTTATRVLETLGGLGVLEAGAELPAPDTASVASVVAGPDGGLSGSTQIYITPGCAFGAVDALLTNFHLPHSTVLALTMAFAGVERLRDAYTEAIAMRYRFFSFGDSMLVEGRDADV
jgi:S-adenosylmethionine:tRNA ribosyltransferase-isomerase